MTCFAFWLQPPVLFWGSVWGLGFGVWGFGVWDLGFGNQGLGFGVWEPGFGVWGLGIRVWGVGVWGLRFGVWGLRMRVWGLGFGGLECLGFLRIRVGASGFGFSCFGPVVGLSGPPVFRAKFFFVRQLLVRRLDVL